MKVPFICLVIFLTMPCILAANIDIEYQIIEDSVLTTIELTEAEDLQLKIPYDAKALEANIEYQIKDDSLIMSGENIEIKYITKAYIDKSGKRYYFIVKNQFQGLSDIAIYLPEGAVITEEGVIFPADYEISTDGRRIILAWDNFSKEQILVSYEFVEEDDWHYIVIIAILIAIIIGIYYISKRLIKKEIKKVKEKARTKKSKSKKEEEITKNLFEKEKEIVKYLLKRKKNEAWTKEIQKDLGIGKVKLSRKLRSLEAKEVIKKIPYGNENRIRLLK